MTERLLYQMLAHLADDEISTMQPLTPFFAWNPRSQARNVSANNVNGLPLKGVS